MILYKIFNHLIYITTFNLYELEKVRKPIRPKNQRSLSISKTKHIFQSTNFKYIYYIIILYIFFIYISLFFSLYVYKLRK